MATRDLEFRVGLIILIGIIVLGGSLYWLRDYQLEHNSRIVTVIFKDVGTLEVGDKVNVSGVRMGKVNKIKLTESGVAVDMLLARNVRLHKDTRFVIKNQGLMGERFIAVYLGQDTTTVSDTAKFIGGYDSGLPEVMGLMGEMIVELRSLVHSFKTTVGSDSSLNRFHNTIKNLESVSGSMDDYMKRNNARLDKTADNFLQASKGLNKMLNSNQEKIDSTTQRFDRISVKLEDFVYQLDSLSISFRQFADNINNPEGSLQLLTEDRRLYDDLRKTADNIDDLVTDIRANPRKYINLKVEIF